MFVGVPERMGIVIILPSLLWRLKRQKRCASRLVFENAGRRPKGQPQKPAAGTLGPMGQLKLPAKSAHSQPSWFSRIKPAPYKETRDVWDVWDV
ncbi:MAG: hypothetical protein AUK28_07530 [Desulfobacterales bacterium CG2_30_60_27]|nr:MAG: hypothetical protein AUK28_07530 [Desulfobacterales bacterium CG2_30_60_27]